MVELYSTSPILRGIHPSDGQWLNIGVDLIYEWLPGIAMALDTRL